MPKSIARRAHEAAMCEQIRCMMAEAGTTAVRRPDGTVAVTNLPRPQVGPRSFLSDELADWQASQRKPRT